MVLWGDSKRTDNNRTVADVVMSCFKIVSGFLPSYCRYFLGIGESPMASRFDLNGEGSKSTWREHLAVCPS